MKKFVTIVALCTGIALHAQQSANSPMTLNQCIETALNNNLDVTQGELKMKSGAINRNQAQMDRFPDLNGVVSAGINQGRSIDPFTNSYINQRNDFSSVGLSSGVVLFDGGTLSNTARQTQLAYQADKMDWQQIKDNITIQVILAYLQVLSNEELLSQAGQQALLSWRQVERLTTLNEEGAIKPAMLTDLKGQYANDQLAIINARNVLASSKLSLAALMNVPYDTAMKVERLDAASLLTSYDANASAIYQEALERFAQVKAAELRTRSYEKAVLAAKGTMFPILSLNGNVNTNYSSAARNEVFLNETDVVSNDYVLVNGVPTQVIRKKANFQSDKIGYTRQLNNNLFNSISLNLRIPLFNSFQARNRVRLAKLDLENYQAIETTTKTQLQQSIEQAYLNFTSASERYKTLLQQVEAYTESFRAAEILFNAGVGNSIDYLTAKNNLDRANINAIAAKYDYVLRMRVLDYYRGR